MVINMSESAPDEGNIDATSTKIGRIEDVHRSRWHCYRNKPSRCESKPILEEKQVQSSHNKPDKKNYNCCRQMKGDRRTSIATKLDSRHDCDMSWKMSVLTYLRNGVTQLCRFGSGRLQIRTTLKIQPTH